MWCIKKPAAPTPGLCGGNILTSSRRSCFDNDSLRSGMKALLVFSLSVVASVNVAAAPGRIILFNGTSSAGKSSLAEVVVQESKTKYEVVSFDDFSRSYREKLGTGQFKREPYGDMRQALYRHANAQADDGANMIIDAVVVV